MHGKAFFCKLVARTYNQLARGTSSATGSNGFARSPHCPLRYLYKCLVLTLSCVPQETLVLIFFVENAFGETRTIACAFVRLVTGPAVVGKSPKFTLAN